MATKKGNGVTRAKVRRLRDRGLTPRQIAARLRISTQAVYAHLERLKKEEAA